VNCDDAGITGLFPTVASPFERNAAWFGQGDESMARSHFPASHLRLKRAYDPPRPDDGVRILVDRLWPRGVRKADAALDDWMKDIAPSTELRRWFGHDPERWSEFQRRNKGELRHHNGELEHIRALARTHTVTLVYSAQDEAHNDAVVLREVLSGRRDEGAR
jgi:uncharacterized protein YeaO (DUF488 family)